MSGRQHTHRRKIRDRSNSNSREQSHGSPISPEMLFTSDRKGDFQNLQYSSIDRRQVPRYRTAGQGRLVGLDRRFRITSLSDSERRVDDQTFDPNSKAYGVLSQHRTVADAGAIDFTSRLTDSDQIREQKNFIAFDHARHRQRKDKFASKDHSEGTALTHTGLGSLRSASDSSSDSSEESAPEPKTRDQSAYEQLKTHPDNEKQIRLRRLTEENPQNVQTWLDLIDHQERYYVLTAAQDASPLNPSDRRAIIDIRVSLYEKAITIVRDRHAREKLILGLMKEGAKIWDTGRQLKEWLSALRETDSVHLRYEFIDFQQSSAVTFSYDTCLSTYLDTFTKALSISHEDRDFHCVYLILRLTTFMREAGFPERAYAIWQALLEFNFFRPIGSGGGIQDLQTFWERECPRIGEKGAKGWSAASSAEVSSRADLDAVEFGLESLLTDWGRSERQRASLDILPARTLDDTLEDDPFRVVLFSDIKEFVFAARHEPGRDLIKQAFLKFCGLPPLSGASESCRKWWVNPFLCNFSSELRIGVFTDTATLFAPFDSPLFIWDVSFQGHQTELDFAVRALTLLAECKGNDERLAEYLIALLFQKDSTKAIKYAKSLLKKKPDSLLLYNAYALMQLRDQSLESAETVISTALSMAGSLGPDVQQYQVVLWHNWIWECLQLDHYDYALYLLVDVMPSDSILREKFQLPSPEYQTSPSRRLRAEAYFRDQISDRLSYDADAAAEFTALYALLVYLSRGRSFSDAMSVYRSTSLLLGKERNPRATERLHQFRARLARFHALTTRSGYRPASVESIFKDSLSVFPGNSAFHHFRETSIGYENVIDRVREVDMDDSRTASSVSSMYAIYREISRRPGGGATTYSLRRAYLNTTASDSPARHCHAVWFEWVRWEVSLHITEPGSATHRVKDFYLSALRSCPWCKSLYLLGFVDDQLSKMLGPTGLIQIYRSMSERGLRIRHDISEVVDDIGAEAPLL